MFQLLQKIFEANAFFIVRKLANLATINFRFISMNSWDFLRTWSYQGLHCMIHQCELCLAVLPQIFIYTYIYRYIYSQDKPFQIWERNPWLKNSLHCALPWSLIDHFARVFPHEIVQTSLSYSGPVPSLVPGTSLGSGYTANWSAWDLFIEVGKRYIYIYIYRYPRLAVAWSSLGTSFWGSGLSFRVVIGCLIRIMTHINIIYYIYNKISFNII